MDAMKPPYVMTRSTLLMLTLLNAAVQSNATSPADDICVDPGASVPKSRLALARDLIAPLAADTERAEFEHAAFWEDHGPLLQAAWNEWEDRFAKTGFPSSGSGSGGSDRDGREFINPALSMALEDAFGNPSEETEATVKSLWAADSDGDEQRPELPEGVYSIRLLPESGISRIRRLLDAATSSGIPTRRPNGMNRHGVIVDPDVYGAVSMKSLVKLVEEELINRVVRPIGRALFPDRVGCDDDLEYFAFTIRYDGGDDDATLGGKESTGNVEKSENYTSNRDFELKEHRDASIVTMNINLNLPEEGYAGSEVFFRDFPSKEDMVKDLPHNGRKDGGTLRFSPGMAIIHLGAHRHGALPISDSTSKDGSGKRYNLVIWLFGKDGDVRISPYEKGEQMSVIDRWRGCNHTQSILFDNP